MKSLQSVISYNYRVIHISHLIVVVLFKLFAKTEKITMEDSRKSKWNAEIQIIWGSHHLFHFPMLFFWVVTSCGLVRKYQRFGGTYCLHLKETSETLPSTCKSTRHHNPEGQHRHLHRRENLRSHLFHSLVVYSAPLLQDVYSEILKDWRSRI
jgi:hypothetical protein